MNMGKSVSRNDISVVKWVCHDPVTRIWRSCSSPPIPANTMQGYDGDIMFYLHNYPWKMGASWGKPFFINIVFYAVAPCNVNPIGITFILVIFCK